MSHNAKFKVWRGDAAGGDLKDYTVEVNEGEVLLDIIHRAPGHTGARPRGALELQGRASAGPAAPRSTASPL